MVFTLSRTLYRLPEVIIALTGLLWWLRDHSYCGGYATTVTSFAGFIDMILKTSGLLLKVTINKSEYLMNIIELNRQLTKTEGYRITNGYDDGGLTFLVKSYSLSIVNMYQWNALLVAAGALQPPVFAKNQPNYQNFAMGGVKLAFSIIGAIIAPGR